MTPRLLPNLSIHRFICVLGEVGGIRKAVLEMNQDALMMKVMLLAVLINNSLLPHMRQVYADEVVIGGPQPVDEEPHLGETHTSEAPERELLAGDPVFLGGYANERLLAFAAQLLEMRGI